MPGQLAGLPDWIRKVVEGSLKEKGIHPDDVAAVEMSMDGPSYQISLDIDHKLEYVNVGFTTGPVLQQGDSLTVTQTVTMS